MTVSTTTGRQEDVVVSSRAQHPGAELADAVRELLDLPGGTTLRVGGTSLDDLTVGDPPLVAGAVLLARPTTSVPAPSIDDGGAPLRLAVTAGRDAGGDLPVRHGTWTVGRSPSSDLVIDDPALSRTHLEVRVGSHGVRLVDLGTTNATYVDGRLLRPDGQLLPEGAAAALGGHRLELRQARARTLPLRPRGDGSVQVSPLPRPTASDEPVVVRFPAAPREERPRRLPWVMVLVPVPVALAMAYFFGPRMLVVALLSPLMVLGSWLSDRVGRRADARREHTRWVVETRHARARLVDAIAAESRALHQRHPDPFEVRRAATLPSARLWERRLGTSGRLAVRIGLGDARGRVVVVRPGDDRDSPALRDVPITLDLDEHPVVALVGTPEETGAHLRWLLGQVLVLHPPGEVEVLAVGRVDGLAGLRHAPHVREAEVGELAGILAQATGAHRTLVVTDDPSGLRRDGTWRALLTEGPAHGVRVLMTATAETELPHECRATVRHEGVRAAVQAGGATLVVRGDGVGEAWAEEVGRALAPLRDATPGRRTGLPRTVALVDVDPPADGPAQLLSRWAEPPPGLRTCLGVTPNGPLVVDLVSDGPHALVGGTTGSGKSELLQTWIVSLAQRYGPDRLTFVLVDYKGGAAFAVCADLPHTVGVLTDLDPAGARRALLSLEAELRRREALLAAAGAAHIDAYQHGGGTLPRLVVVIDEFRVLAQEQPDILAGIVRLAAVGRSLGLHLILATQRPAGVVTPEIKANVNLRIALRVRDRVDSDDIIGSHDAADIPASAAGRALLRTGGEPVMMVQTAYVGGVTTRDERLVVRRAGRLPDDDADNTGRPHRTHPGDGVQTDLHELVALARSAWTLAGADPPHRPWLPPLPSHLEDDEVPAVHVDVAVWGLTDLPAEQRQDPLTWQVGDGHLLVVGGPRSGRSSALASLAGRVPAALGGHAVVHALGTSGPGLDALRRLPAVRSCLDTAATGDVHRLVERLRRDVDERRRALAGSGHATFEGWWKAWRAGDAGPPPPVCLLVVDGWSSLARTDDVVRAGLSSAVEGLARDGTGVGLRLVVAGGRELVTGRLTSLAARRLVLNLPDRADRLALGVAPDLAPDDPRPGRGVVLPDQVLAQVALPSSARGQAMDLGPWGWSVTELPSRVGVGELEPAPGRLLVGHAGTPGSPATVELDHGVFAVVGPARSGRSSTVRLLAEQLSRQGRPVVRVGEGWAADALTTLRVDPGDADGLVAAVQQHEGVVVVLDDVEDLTGTPVDGVVRSLVQHCSRGGGIVLAATTTGAAAAVRGLAPQVCRARAGILLQPQARTDGDCLGVRVPPTERIPGRGYLVDHGTATEVQVALPA